MHRRNQTRLNLLRTMFDAAVDVAKPASNIRIALPPRPEGRTIVVGAGKAAALMAHAVEEVWPDAAGLIVVPYGCALPCRRIAMMEARHPLPDENGLCAAREILHLVSGLSSSDLVLCLISGGGSALLTAPTPALHLDEKQDITSTLLRSGATITEMNCVRKHLSLIKGGRLALACEPAHVVSLIVSDVPGDDISVIASGPTSPDLTTSKEALAILDRYQIPFSKNVRKWLHRPESETPKPDHPVFRRTKYHIVATPSMALQAAARVSKEAGYLPVILGDAIEGEAREVGRALAGIARSAKAGTSSFTPPCVLLSGGETTVTVRGRGRGGRNCEFLLGLVTALESTSRIYALAADTDGQDGQAEIAGAVVAPDTLSLARLRGLDPYRSLSDNDAGRFFEQLGDVILTGPTFTNVNDFRAILIDSPE